MKRNLQSVLGVSVVIGLSLVLLAGSSYGAVAGGVYAYVDVPGGNALSAKVREFVSISKGSKGYYVRLTTGHQIVVPVNNYKGGVSYPSLRGGSLKELKASRERMRQFMSTYPASSPYLTRRTTNLSLKILQIEKNVELENKKRLGDLILKNGKKYQNAILSEKLDDGIKIVHQVGIITIPVELLPEAVVKKLGGFDDAKIQRARLEKKLTELEERAKADNLSALWELANIYKDGESVTKDLAKSFQYSKKAADLGHAPSQLLVGLGYYKGEAIKKDFRLASSWVSKAAKQGHSGAQVTLGVFYLRGDGVEKNSVLACEWLEKAVESGNPEAQYLLGVCHYIGEGVGKDRLKSKGLLEKSRDAGIKSASRFISKYPF